MNSSTLSTASTNTDLDMLIKAIVASKTHHVVATWADGELHVKFCTNAYRELGTLKRLMDKATIGTAFVLIDVVVWNGEDWRYLARFVRVRQ